MMSAEMGHLVVLSLALGAFVIALGCAPTQEPADLVLRDGKIMTVEEAMPEAETLAVKGDEIIAVGSNDEIDAYIGPSTDVIDLGGQPGL